jgi:hypothetical protein
LKSTASYFLPWTHFGHIGAINKRKGKAVYQLSLCYFTV